MGLDLRGSRVRLFCEKECGGTGNVRGCHTRPVAPRSRLGPSRECPRRVRRCRRRRQVAEVGEGIIRPSCRRPTDPAWAAIRVSQGRDGDHFVIGSRHVAGRILAVVAGGDHHRDAGIHNPADGIVQQVSAQGPSAPFPPRLMLTTSIVSLLATTQSNPQMTSDHQPAYRCRSTLTAQRRAPGATPTTPDRYPGHRSCRRRGCHGHCRPRSSYCHRCMRCRQRHSDPGAGRFRCRAPPHRHPPARSYRRSWPSGSGQHRSG